MTNERDARLIRQKYREYLIPAVLTSAALALASVVDSAIVGNLLGAKELAGIGACSPIIAIINALFLLFAMGGATKASIALGERKKDKADTYFSVTVIVGLLVAAAFVLVMELVAEPVTLLLSKNDPELAAMTMRYYRPIVFVFPALLIAMGIPQFIRIDGHPKMASYIALVSNGINLIFDYVLIKYFDAGLMGASLSTVLGYLLGAGLVVPWLLSKKRSFHLVNPFKAGFFRDMAEVFSGGSSSFFMNLSDFFKRMLLNIIVLYYLGNPGLSVLTVCNSLQFFARSILKGGSDAFLPIVGSLYGQKDYYGIRQCVNRALRYVGAAGALIVIVMLAAPRFVGGLFGLGEGEIAQIAEYAIRLLAVSIPFMGLNVLLQTLYNTTGRATLSSTISILEGVGYICLFAFLLPMIAPGWFWASFVVAELMTLLTALIIGLIIKKKEGAIGYLLLRPLPEDLIYRSFTVEAAPEAAVSLSQQIRDEKDALGLDESLVNRMSVAVEEMTVAVCEAAKNQKKKPVIDVQIEKNTEETILSFRENGKPVNLLTEDPENPRPAGDGIAVFMQMAKSTEYSRQLGFNTIVAKF